MMFAVILTVSSSVQQMGQKDKYSRDVKSSQAG